VKGNIRSGFLIVLSCFLLLGCTTNAATDTEQDETENQEQSEVEQEEQRDDARVVTIEDKTFADEDFEFYTLMNQIKIALQIDVAESEKEVTYWEEQRAYYENVNVNLQSLIELYGMSLLAEEKNYFVPDEKLQDAVATYKERVNHVTEAVRLIEEFGQEKYNRHIEEYIRQTMLRDRIAKELEERIAEDNPEATEEEINYMVEQEFEELLMSHMATLEMEIHLK